jgi:hypothetical protein
MTLRFLSIKSLWILLYLIPFMNVNAQKSFESEIISTVINSELRDELKLHRRDTIFNKKGQIKRIKGFTFTSIYMKPYTQTERQYQPDTLFKYCKMFMSDLDREVFDDFLSKNLTPIRIDTIKKLNFEIKPLPDDFIGDGHNPIITVSRPGINAMKNKALIYYSRRWGPLAGFGSYYLLIKSSNGWVIKQSGMMWIS